MTGIGSGSAQKFDLKQAAELVKETNLIVVAHLTCIGSSKDEIFKISWYMRGGVTSQELLHIYSYEDRTIMSNIIKDNIETTQKTKLPFV